MRAIKTLIIHCSATPNGRPHTAAEIDHWHRERGWSGIGYHFVLRLEGVLEAGRPPERAGAHAKGHNHDSLGLCLIGTDRFTPAQWTTLAAFVSALVALNPGLKILGHRELPGVNKYCPGFDVAAWLQAGMAQGKVHHDPS